MKDARCLGCPWLFWPGNGGKAQCMKDDGFPCDRPAVPERERPRRRRKPKED